MLNRLFGTSGMRDDDQTYLSSFFESVRFFVYRGRGHLMRYLLNRLRWHVYPRFQRLTPFPDHVDVETSSACNMKCPMCFTITDTYKGNVNITVMKLELFQKIVDECVANDAFSIRMSWRGEPTVNPRFVDMVRYAKQKGIREVSTLSNILKLTPEMFEELVDIGLDWLTISFDGMGETYNKIRAPAKFEDAVAKIRKFHEIKKRKGSVKPVIRIQGVWPAVKENPQAFYDTFRGIVDQVAVNPLLDYLRNDTELVYRKDFTCPVLWQRLAVGADGKVFLCIHDELSHHLIGDVNRQSIKAIWNGPALNEAREAHLRHIGIQQYSACRECFLPRASVGEQQRIGDRVVTVENMVNRVGTVGR